MLSWLQSECKGASEFFSKNLTAFWHGTRKPSISGKPRLSNDWCKTQLECLLPNRPLHFLILTSIPVEFMTVAPSGPDWWLWNKQHNNVPGSSAPQVNVVYRRLSTAVLALCNTPYGLGINLTFPDSCSCHRTLKFNFLPLCVCREAVELLLWSSPITVSLLVTLIQFPLLYHLSNKRGAWKTKTNDSVYAFTQQLSCCYCFLG